jgi:uncharacterized protein YndB with AHSA1/START domain
MRVLTLTAEVPGQAGDVFEVLTDLRGYGRWLGPSGEYAGTVDISDGEVGEGTTYVEHSGVGVRRGRVTELRAPERVVFHQPMHLRPALAGVIDIVVTYTLRQEGANVHVERVVEVGLPWPLRLAGPLVPRRFRRESVRTLRALEAFLRSRSPD